MKVYVDELPKDCLDCPCNSESYYCNALNQDIGLLKYGEIHQDCPLQTLADHDKQVRKQVCDEIRELAGNYFNLPICYNCGETSNDDVILTGNDLTEILDQIEKGE